MVPPPRSRADAPGPTPEAAAVTPARRPDVDWLRVVAIAAVFAVHVAQVYTPWQTWHVQSPERSEVLGEIALVVWPWVMPLFMLLAGSGAYFSLGRRTNGAYLKERSLRILLPLLAGTVLVVPPQVYVERLAQGRFQGNYFSFLPRFFQGVYPAGNLTAGHLWFLGYLYAYALLTLPLLRWIRDGGGRRWLDRLARFCRRPGGLLWLGVPPVASQLLLRARFPRSLTFVDDWAHHAWLLSAFLLGFLLVARREVERALDEQWPFALAPALACTTGIAVFAWVTPRPGVIPTAYGGPYFAFWSAFGVAGWCWLLVLLGVARRYVRKRGPVLDYASTLVYPFYIFHQTVIVVLAYVVIRSGVGVWAGFGVLLAGSLAGTLALTEAVRRWPAVRGLYGYPRKR